MSAVALIAAIGLAQAAPAPAPSPLFAAFKAACYDLKTADGESAFDGISPAAKAAGWTEATDAATDPRIRAIIEAGRKAVMAEEPDGKLSGQTFRHRFDGRDVWLVTSRYVSKEGYWGDGCRAYDLDAPAPTRETVDAWVGKPPTGVQANGTATKRLWEPWKIGVGLEITYVPRDHPLGKSYGVQGLVLVAESIGGF